MSENDGNIRYSQYGESMNDIPLNEDVFPVSDKLNQETKNNLR